MTRRTTILTCSAFLLAALLAAIVGRPAYSRYKAARALRQARAFLDSGDLRNASLSARQALSGNPRSLEASRLMATMAEATSSPQLLDWRRRIVELSPTIENKLSLAAAALQVESPPYALAAEVMTELRALATNRVAYSNLSADLALKLGHRSEAELWFETACQLQPSNSLHQLNLAVLRLGDTNALVSAKARHTLVSLRTNTSLAEVALRSLVADSLLRRDLPQANCFSTELLSKPGATFVDRVQHLGIMTQVSPQELESFLARISGEASTNAAKAHEVSNCLLRHGLPERASQWLASCPPHVQTTQPIPVAKVDCLFMLKHWAEAETFLAGQKWDELEPMRLALLSHASRELRDTEAADLRWRLALRQARGRLGTLMWLTSKAEEWGMASTKIDLLWEIVHQFPPERWALAELTRYYFSTGNTRGLNQVFEQMSGRNPGDRSALNNFALTSLLLGTNEARAHETASELYRQFPGDPAIVSTYAYSLHRLHRTAEGLEILQNLDPGILVQPDIALYYGILLRAEGQAVNAEHYLKLAQTAVLLPEERELWKRQPQETPNQ